VGGFAVIFHAQPRFTKDLGLYIKADAENAKATYAALAAFGAALKDIRPEDFADRGSFFRFGRDPRGFDILPEILGVDFDAAWDRRVESVVDVNTGLKANFISAADLIEAGLRKAAGFSGRGCREASPGVKTGRKKLDGETRRGCFEVMKYGDARVSIGLGYDNAIC
jgi:hypothetical protein